MLLVRVKLGPSAIHGIGVFADQAIPKGTPVWRFTAGFDLELDPADVEVQPPVFREQLLHYGYVDRRLARYVLCCDDARFLNHSPVPNLVQDLSVDRHGIDVAVRDIAQGEELTVDYGNFEMSVSCT